MDPQLIARFTVPGRPVPKARPRVAQDRRGRNRSFTDTRTVEHEALVARCAPVQGDPVAPPVRNGYEQQFKTHPINQRG